MKSLIALFLFSLTALPSYAGAPPKIDPNAPPPEYYVEPSEPEVFGKKAKKAEKVKKTKKDAEATK